MRSLTVQIPQPCHERWADMQPTERGRFCASCQKTVVDYSALTDQELMRLLSKPLETTCGRFRNEQLNRPLTVSNPGITAVWHQWVSLLTMSLFGWQTAQAQGSQASKPPQPTSVRPAYSVMMLPVRAVGGSVTKRVISGRVMLMDSSGRLSPVSAADVGISRWGERWQTQTDSTGAFSLTVLTRNQIAELTVGVSAPDHLYANTTVDASSTTSIVLDDIILHERMRPKAITSGGMAFIQTPSRWQKLKRKLFRKG